LDKSYCVGGGCTCSTTGFVVDKKQIDPDDSLGACQCTTTGDWAPVESCCGDDKSDCGVIADQLVFLDEPAVDQYLCSMDENFRGTWVSAEGVDGQDNNGLIVYAGCNDREYLSNGETWLQCGGFRIEEAGNHQYLCTGTPGKDSWIECCGVAGCNSGDDGGKLSSGGSVLIGQTTYYCASNSKFTTDLDITDRITCDSVQELDGTSAGFKWTGSLCCSEADDFEEYYNDPGGNGGCWNKEVIPSGSSDIEDREDIGNLNGQFFGCNVQDQQILNLKDFHTQQQLVENVDLCTQDDNRQIFCSFNNRWENSNGQDRSHLSTVPAEVNPNPQQTSECCSIDSCWNGQECITNQKNDPTSTAINDRRCIDGEWELTSLKRTPDGRTGFCPDQNKCLINPNANTEDRCVEEGVFTRDDYCESGDWTSRTKFVSLQLINLAQANDYVLFCDTPQNTLNDLKQQIGGVLAETIVSTENTNNFCVLSLNDKVFIGTSLNNPIDDSDLFLRSIGIDNCDSALTDDGQYHSCSGQSQDIGWYNLNLNSIIYSKQPFTIGTTNFQDAFREFLSSPFNVLINSIINIINEPFDTSFVEGINKFDKLYLSRTGSKEIRGAIEGLTIKNLVIEYKNFDTDICSFISEFDEKNKDLSSGIQCEKEGNTHYVLAQGTATTNFNPGKIWQDLTSKLRIN